MSDASFSCQFCGCVDAHIEMRQGVHRGWCRSCGAQWVATNAFTTELEDAGDDYRLSSATRKEWAERALAAEAQIKCPIDLDATPELCSAGTCPKCLSERSLKAEERVKELEAQQKRDHANINLKADFIEKTMGDFHEMEAERDRLRDARDLAYGLLWSISLDALSPPGRAWSLARKALLGTMTKGDQSRSIELARAALKGET